ncbi:MAG: hypothetical protein ABIC04_02545 [Nanoarchaeota archaeon]
MKKQNIVLICIFCILIYSSVALSLQVDSAQYFLGDIVNIKMDPAYANEEYRLEIVTKEFVYRYLEIIQNSITFFPKYAGDYRIVLIFKENGEIVAQTSFIVADGEDITPQKRNDNITNWQEIEIKVRSNKNQIRSRKASILQKRVLPSQTGIQDVELIPEGKAINKIVFRNLDIRQDLELGFDDIKDTVKIRKINKNLRKLYAIDPSKLSFSEATVTSIATGRELFKCKDWNFDIQECQGAWAKIMDIVPGQEYSFTLTQTDPGYGETGPPEPHNIEGKIINLDGTGVENGIPVLINNTNTDKSFLAEVYAPPIPSLKGSYSAVINGSDNDDIIVSAWNSTHFGRNSSILYPTTTTVNVKLNTTRPAETNVTIIDPLNNTIVNSSNPFNVTVNISVVGGQNGNSCNATISFSNTSVLELNIGDNLTHLLGPIPLYTSVLAVWSIAVKGVGTTNITVDGVCKNNTEDFAGSDHDTLYNISTKDTSAPDIKLISPMNNSMSNRNITFYYNVSDVSFISNCSLIINNTILDNNTNIDKSFTQNFTYFLNFGHYTYSINCTDGNNYESASDLRFIRVSDQDLTLTYSDISFSDETPTENDKIIINATIYNIGSENITSNITVQIYNGDPNISGIQIGNNITIKGLQADSNLTIGTNWTITQGTHNIFILIDVPINLNGSIIESNESNNQANNTIFLPAYQIFYGNISVSIILSTIADNSVYMWFNQSDVTGNVFVIDSDSSIDWTNLSALGINVTGKNSTRDFDELDYSLNLTELADSINRSYTFHGNPKKFDSFTIYSLDIDNVPIINSTNTSNFVTGILWDQSDFNTGEYNGSQDIAFVTRINSNNFGKYGIYDYEVKIPANLRNYIKPNNENSVTLYSELK